MLTMVGSNSLTPHGVSGLKYRQRRRIAQAGYRLTPHGVSGLKLLAVSALPC